MFIRFSLIFIGGACWVSSCISFQTVTWREEVTPKRAISGRTALLSSVDKDNLDFREKKEKEFIELADHSLDHLKLMLEKRAVPAHAVHNRRVNPAKQDSTLALALPDQDFRQAIIITSLSASFDQTGWYTSEDDDGDKVRIREFDIVSEISYRLVSSEGKQFDTTIVARQYYGERSGLAGAIGPSITANAADAKAVVELNALLYLNSFFPWMREKRRYLYTASQSSAMEAVLKKNDYQKALDISRGQLRNPKPLTASMVNYNCAVLSEALGDKTGMLEYLRKANSLNPVAPGAAAMSKEYSNQ